MARNVALLGLVLIASSAFLCLVAALPVTQNKKAEKDAKAEAEASTPATADVETALEYERYLREVVEALEADPEFRKKLDKAPEADIRVSKREWQVFSSSWNIFQESGILPLCIQLTLIFSHRVERSHRSWTT